MSNNTQNTQNNPFTATELLEFANLQIAAEALYGLMANKERGITENKLGNPANIENNPIITNNRDELIDFLTDGNYHSSKFSTTQAEQFVENWEIVSHIANTSSGFSGTLFEAKENIPSANIKKGDLVLSFRSTEFIEDYIHDNIATNTHEIADKGWAFGQISDMEQWFNTLATDL
ncbi:MAG: hypothetical protein IK065_01960, partial [Neisseriaceae bacterium]|nr:hypothetical protein [Neisseriaceae bacterium]